MKKCPGCGSLASDYSTACGLCGKNLRDVGFYQGTAQDAAREARIEQETSEKRLQKTEFNRGLRSWLSGVLSGLALALVGFLTVEFGNNQISIVYVGYVLILIGFLIAARAFFGIKGRKIRGRW